jgi:hypothetical protein
MLSLPLAILSLVIITMKVVHRARCPIHVLDVGPSYASLSYHVVSSQTTLPDLVALRRTPLTDPPVMFQDQVR